MMGLFSISGSSSDNKMNKTKRVPTSPAPMIECACYPPDTCEGSQDHCFTQFGVSIVALQYFSTQYVEDLA